MLTREDMERICCDYINTILFSNVWNEPHSEFRVNLKPLTFGGTRIYSGSFSIPGRSIFLPTRTDQYHLLAVSASSLNASIGLETMVWYDLKTICNEWNTLIQAFTTNGRMLSKNSVYLMYSVNRSTIFIAIKRSVWVKSKSPRDTLDDIYLTIYYDSDLPNDTKIESVTIESSLNVTDYQYKIESMAATATDACQLTFYKNGMELSRYPSYDDYSVGTSIDVVVDKNILFSFEIDITTDNENPVYLSDRDSTWKQLIHIPKELNPENNIYTHNTCTFHVREFSGDLGLYIGHVGDRKFTQVTHNDMSIPLFVIDAYRDELNMQHVRLRCDVRKHDKDNVLIRDASFIDLLYSERHTDQDIISILCGDGPEKITWWKASELEKSKYVSMFFDTPNLATTDNIDDYVDAIGYYKLVDLLCQRIIDITVTDGFVNTISLPLPILYSGFGARPVVYWNNRLISDSFISYETGESNIITVSIDESLVMTPGDKLTFIFYIDGDNSIYEFIPSGTTRDFHIPFEDFSIYAEKVLNGYSVSGISGQSSVVYEELSSGTNHFAITKNPDGTSEVLFNESLIGRRIIIQNKYCTYSKIINLKEYISDGKNIAVPLTAAIKGKDEYVPIIQGTVSLYLNGNYLVKGLDYLVNRVTDNAGNLSFAEVIVQTMDYFKEDGQDELFIIVHSAEVDDLSAGFVYQNTIKDETPINLYFPNISLVHINGVINRDVDYRGIYIRTNGIQDGAKFEVQTEVPGIIRDFIERFSTNRDLERIKLLNEYFYDFGKTEISEIILESKHRIYSIFMNKFIYDVLTENTVITDDPDVNRMKDQIRPYLPLQSTDICFGNISKVFVDFYPRYVNSEIPLEHKRLVDRFISQYMPKNYSPTTEVVYE